MRGLGPVLIERSLRAKRIVISIRPSRGVRVAVPVRESFMNAERFLASKVVWIQRHLEKMRLYEIEREATRENREEIDMLRAKTILIGRLDTLAERHGFKYGHISIRCQRTRWGSCSPKNNISLNARLLNIPPELMDYVIFHELVHTRVHDHSPKFWKELDRYVGDSKAKAKRLKAFGMELI